MLKMQRANGQADLSSIKELENRIGVDLPADYRAFLEAVNGGKPAGYEFQVPSWGNAPLQSLYGVGIGGRMDLLSICGRRGAHPIGLLPIGHDAGGNLICLRLRGPGFGSIYFCDHEVARSEDEGGERGEGVYLLATSFSDFAERRLIQRDIR